MDLRRDLGIDAVAVIVVAVYLCLDFLLMPAAYAQSQPTTQAKGSAQAYSTYIPVTGGENYYNFYGDPEIETSVSGNDMSNRWDTVTLLVTLVNHGRITGFKQDRTPTTPTEYALDNAEQQEAGKITNALNLKATLLTNTS